MKQPSQCDRVLAVLADGLSHDIAEIHERAGTMRLNSRVAELRKRGHEIVCECAGGIYSYQLRSLREPEPRGPLPSISPSAMDARHEFDSASGAALPPASSGSRSEGGDVSNPNVQADQASQPSPICKAPSSLNPSGASGVGYSAVTGSAPRRCEEEGVMAPLATRAPDAPEQLTLDVAA